jgi:acid phosphatase type 7
MERTTVRLTKLCASAATLLALTFPILAPAPALAMTPPAGSAFGAVTSTLVARESGSPGASASGGTAATDATATFVGAGDIASCSGTGDSRTAALIANIPGTVFTTGDNVYPNGAMANYTKCYEPTWGAFKARTRPVPGNHDYENYPGAPNYFAYFGGNAGRKNRGYYRYDLNGWRIYALNSECAVSTSCFKNQYAWLRTDLIDHPHECVIALWHRPRWSTGPHGNSTRMASVVQLLYDHGAEIVLNGHDHMYERYVPLSPGGTPDALNGIREFVVGTGGASLYGFKTTDPNVAVRDDSTHGVLKLTLSAGTYSWQFVPTTSGGFSDSGTDTCH